MEEEIEVGEWIRSKDGFIGKVQKINYDNMEKSNYYICEKDNVMASNYLENIAKHSKQLVNLIDVGDFVNGFPILEPIYNGNTMYGIDEGYENFKKSFGEIKTILTGESYMANCYKVGGEEDD